jgi:endonuclease YncB( thermonuclease family)
MRFFTRCIVFFCVLLVASGALAKNQKKWRVLRDCKLIPNASNDGDSFHVRHKKKHYIFRLCFVDAPETSRSIPRRITEQALWWDIPEADVTRHGDAATAFTLDFLKDGFTVYTQYKDARGKSALKRNFAMIKVDGEFLSRVLARKGLARAYGYLADLPDGTSRWKYRKELQALEKKAKSSHRGTWGNKHPQAQVPRAPEIADEEGTSVTLTRSVALYASGASTHFIGMLKSGDTVFVLDEAAGNMVKVRVTFRGKTIVGRCRKRDLRR